MLNPSIYKEKLQGLRQITSDVEYRAEQLTKRDHSFKQLNEILSSVYDHLTNVYPTTKPWLTEQQTFSLRNEYNQTLEWFHNKYEEQSKPEIYEKPLVTYQEIDAKRKRLENLLTSTNRTQKI